MNLKRFFNKIKILLRRLTSDGTVQKVLNFVGTIRLVVESPATASIISITETQADDKARAELLAALDKTDTFIELVKNAKDKEADMLPYFIEQIRKQSKNKRASLYLALASELLMLIRQGTTRCEANTEIQLAYQAKKYGENEG